MKYQKLLLLPLLAAGMMFTSCGTKVKDTTAAKDSDPVTAEITDSLPSAENKTESPVTEAVASSSEETTSEAPVGEDYDLFIYEEKGDYARGISISWDQGYTINGTGERYSFQYKLRLTNTGNDLATYTVSDFLMHSSTSEETWDENAIKPSLGGTRITTSPTHDCKSGKYIAFAFDATITDASRNEYTYYYYTFTVTDSATGNKYHITAYRTKKMNTYPMETADVYYDQSYTAATGLVFDFSTASSHIETESTWEYVAEGGLSIINSTGETIRVYGYGDYSIYYADGSGTVTSIGSYFSADGSSIYMDADDPYSLAKDATLMLSTSFSSYGSYLENYLPYYTTMHLYDLTNEIHYVITMHFTSLSTSSGDAVSETSAE